MTPRDDFPGAVVETVRRHFPPTVAYGVVLSQSGDHCRVTLDGSSVTVRALLSKGMLPRPGEQVILVRAQTSREWVVLAAVESRHEGKIPDGAGGSVPFAPPQGISATGRPGAIVVQWHAPVQARLVFEVQINDTAAEDGNELRVLVTQGSYLHYYCTGGTTKYFRARSVGTDFAASGWSAWVGATAALALPLDDAITPTKGTLLVGDGSEFVALAPGADGLVLTTDSTQPYGLKWAAGGAPPAEPVTGNPIGLLLALTYTIS